MMTLAFEVSLHSLCVESYLPQHHHNELGWAGLTTSYLEVTSCSL